MDRKRSCADPAGAALARQFRTVAAYYRGVRLELEKQGSWSYRMTSSGAWALSRPAHVFYFLRTTGIPKESLFIDLGSGNGIVACIAGIFTRSVGIESDPDLVASARTAAGRLGLDGRVSFIRADYFDQRIRRADYLYVYPDKPLYRLEEILCGWGGTLLVYGPHFPLKNLAAVQRRRCGKETFTVYRGSLGSDVTDHEKGKAESVGRTVRL